MMNKRQAHMTALKGMLIGAVSMLALPSISVAQSTADLPVVTPQVSCDALGSVDLTAIGGEGSMITSTALSTSDGIPVCSVTGILAPEVNFQVLLPTETWTQRYLQVGCGGLCGSINLRSGASSGCQVLNDGGFVMAATDMGHAGFANEWTLDEQKREDFAYRGQHITTLSVKLLIETFYGQAEQYAYFNGCSDGGREAMIEAQRFPDDFDGVIAGAPAMLFQVQNTLFHGWQATANTAADGSVILTSANLGAVHDAVIAQCDATDGLEDGIISQPAACDFDPALAICAADATDASGCLSADQAQVVRDFLDGPRDAETGAWLTAGQTLIGSETGWQGVYVADGAEDTLFSRIIVQPVQQQLAFEVPTPDATIADMEFTEATLDALRPRHPLYDGTNPDLSAFEQSGGKLILWHGLEDAHIAPANTLALHQEMINLMGNETVAGFERLFFLPGVGHCGGGQGPDKINLLTAMMAWVENGTAPDVIQTSSTGETSAYGGLDDSEAGGRPPRERFEVAIVALPEMTRPVYPYPFVAQFTGEGDYTDTANWEKGDAAQIVAMRAWPGSDLFTAGSYAAN